MKNNKKKYIYIFQFDFFNISNFTYHITII